MRRIFAFFLAFSLIFACAVGVSAASAPFVGTYATVSNDGTCQVSVTVKLRLDEAVPNLKFPVPGDAYNVMLNGSRVRTQLKNGSRQIDLGNAFAGVVGDVTLTVSYALDDLVATNEAGLLQLQLPMLSGFAYPVQGLEFSVTLPGQIETKPAFSSGYHQADIEKDLVYTVSGATISGSSQKELKDHETLSMSLIVSEEMFPQTRMELPDLQLLHILMGISAALALVYWLIFLSSAPYRRNLSPFPPDGCTAGELGSVLTLQGADLTLMIFSWAQLGYITIQPDRTDKVLLHKRMDMGNERTTFEQKCFRQLFAKRDLVDTSSSRYTELVLKVRKMKPPVQAYLRNNSGNPKIFRLIAALFGLFGGVCLGISLSAGAALQWLWVCVLAILGAWSAWAIQQIAYSLFLAGKRSLWIGLGCCFAWCLLGILARLPGLGFLVCGVQFLVGLMAVFGGRRTEAGRQACQDVLGLRRYLCKADKGQIQQILQRDPEYFHSLAPYALALGANDRFAKRFGKTRIPECPYLQMQVGNQMTAQDWSEQLERVMALMNAGVDQRSANKLLNMLKP